MNNIDNIISKYVVDNLFSYEELHSFGSPFNFHEWIKNNIIPLEERDLVKDEEYFCIIVTNEKRIKGIKAKWNGNKFNFSNVGKVDIVIPIKDFNF